MFDAETMRTREQCTFSALETGALFHTGIAKGLAPKIYIAGINTDNDEREEESWWTVNRKESECQATQIDTHTPRRLSGFSSSANGTVREFAPDFPVYEILQDAQPKGQPADSGNTPRRRRRRRHAPPV